MTSLARAGSADGVESADTARVVSIAITPLTENLANGEQRGRWHIGLRLNEKPYDAEVIVDRQSDSVVVKRSHKPIGSN
jgi:hypothetical protein